MSYTERDLTNPPAYYYRLSNKQKRNWRRNTRKIEKNEALRSKYPPFQPSSEINIIHLHHRTDINTLNELIAKAAQTHRYVLDTECAKNEQHEKGALVQLQCIHSTNHSTVILMEMNYLPHRTTSLFQKIEKLWSTIFNNNNQIITWGSIEDELKDFQHIEFTRIGKNINHVNLQFLFRSWYNKHQITHPVMERRDDDDSEEERMDGIDDEFNMTDDTSEKVTWSLQDAIAITFQKFLDKSLTINWWQCGLDLQLNTWKDKLFSRSIYDEEQEKQQRLAMIEYATNDCTSVAELFYHMYLTEDNDQQPPQTPITTRKIIITSPEPQSRININDLQDDLSEISDDDLIELLKPRFYENDTQQQSSNPVKNELIITPPAKKSRININDLQDDLSQISDDELVEILKPRFYKNDIQQQPLNPARNELIITTTTEEMNEFNSTEQQPQKLTLTKAERQRKRNMKFKWKKKHHPEFENKIKRPIYYRYDYRKIRSQLLDDNIYTSHQITINRHKAEVLIGFKSKQEQETAAKKIKINYFSRKQYIERWG